MGSQRTSQKDVLNAIEALTAAITSSMQTAPVAVPVAAPTAAPVVNPAILPMSQAKPAPVVEAKPEVVEIDKGYRAIMQKKALAYGQAHGEKTVLYTRHNQRGEVKLAYCLASKWTGLKDKGLIGAIELIEG